MDPEKLQTIKKIILSDPQGKNLFDFLGFDDEEFSGLNSSQDLLFLTSAVLSFIKDTENQISELNDLLKLTKNSFRDSVFKGSTTVFDDIFNRYIIEKAISFLLTYIRGFRHDSMVILRSFIEYLLFAIWIDTVTRFWPSLEAMWKIENWYDHFEAHKMSINDHNLKMRRLRRANALMMLSQDEFEKKFSLEGNPADFLLFLFKPVCSTCLNRDKKKWWFYRTKFLSFKDIQEKFGIDKLHLSSVLDEKNHFKDKDQISGEDNNEIDFGGRLRLMTLLSKRAENERLLWNFIDFSYPIFGFEHVKKCSYCQKRDASRVILQVPSLNIIFIWLQKLYPESVLQIKKIKMLFIQLSNDFTHFSTSILPGRDKVIFKFYDDEFDLFNPVEMAKIISDLSRVTLNFTLFLKKLLESQKSITE
ncbi:MAG: hypothetical protein ACTSP4_02320 [Candidatus Hodarchaeales archaeon]